MNSSDPGHLDPDSDIYGRHAAGPDRPVGLPVRLNGPAVWADQTVVLPWSLVAMVAGWSTGGRHAVRPGHPAGMYFERAGVVHHEPFSALQSYPPERVEGILPWSRVGTLLRHGEKPLKKLTSRD